MNSVRTSPCCDPLSEMLVDWTSVASGKSYWSDYKFQKAIAVCINLSKMCIEIFTSKFDPMFLFTLVYMQPPFLKVNALKWNSGIRLISFQILVFSDAFHLSKIQDEIAS